MISTAWSATLPHRLKSTEGGFFLAGNGESFRSDADSMSPLPVLFVCTTQQSDQPQLVCRLLP